MNLTALPALNALLNSAAACCLIAGFVAIKRRNKALHLRCMLSAAALSALFLISYLTYHAVHGSTRLTGQGPIRTVYLTILLTHTVLAAVNVPLILGALWLAWRGNFAMHRRVARITWPSWLYVSVTGVVIYLMLYQL